jgi:uncharacterized membrane protein
MDEANLSKKALHRAGLALGIGLGGFLDGIVLHQILQWHHLVCRTATCEVHTLAEFKTQSFEDGLFHLAVWCVTFAGVVLLFRAMLHATIVPRGRALAGSMLIGWGSFNLIEGLIDHHLLGIHHVLAGSRYQTLADWTFLVASLLLVVFGSVVRASAHSRLP